MKPVLVERQTPSAREQSAVLVNSAVCLPVSYNKTHKANLSFLVGIAVEQHQWRVNLVKPKGLEGLLLGEKTKSELQIQISGNTRISDRRRMMGFFVNTISKV